MSLSGSKSNPERKDKQVPKLPWWVELLFVQIGLPDKWLPKLLKSKSSTEKFVSSRKRTMFYLFLFVLGMVYINPYTRYFRNQNTCIDLQRNILEQGLSSKNKNLNYLTSQAVMLCNSNKS